MIGFRISTIITSKYTFIDTWIRTLFIYKKRIRNEIIIIKIVLLMFDQWLMYHFDNQFYFDLINFVLMEIHYETIQLYQENFHSFLVQFRMKVLNDDQLLLRDFDFPDELNITFNYEISSIKERNSYDEQSLSLALT